MKIDLSNRLYKNNGRVYFGTTEITLHNQRGRLFVKHRGKQINIKNIPLLPPIKSDPVFQYIFEGGSESHPCHAMDYWIIRWRLKQKISIANYKKIFIAK